MWHEAPGSTQYSEKALEHLAAFKAPVGRLAGVRSLAASPCEARLNLSPVTAVGWNGASTGEQVGLPFSEDLGYGRFPLPPGSGRMFSGRATGPGDRRVLHLPGRARDFPQAREIAVPEPKSVF
jgi:hypothetical protein